MLAQKNMIQFIHEIFGKDAFAGNLAATDASEHIKTEKLYSLIISAKSFLLNLLK